MGASTRPTHHRRQTSRTLLPCLAAILIFASGEAQATPSKMDETSAITAAPPPPTGDETTAISSVEPGQEGLELSARFSSSGEAIAKDVSWTVHNANGAVVFEDITAIAKMNLSPGNYRIEASYGTAHIEEGVNLPEGINLGLNLVLNAGGLRLLPRIEGSLPVEVASVSRVFALSGSQAGKVVATSRIPGEILKLSAGDYRVESRFEQGNAIAVTEVHIKPGIMSAVEINHHAGLAHFGFTKDTSAAVTWDVTREGGEALPEFSGLDGDMVLKPGHYQAIAHFGANVSTVNFTIEPGQSRDVIVGN